MQTIPTGYTYDDVMLVPKRSRVVSRVHIDTSTRLTKSLKLNIPIISANMDTVTEAKMCIALARLGGIGIIHRFLPIQDQVEEVLKVKRSESVLIDRPFTLSPEQTLREARTLKEKFNTGGFAVIDHDNKLVGILTTRDTLFEDDEQKKVKDLMTKSLITAPVGTSLERAREILQQHKIEKLPIVDETGILRGMVTAQDIIKKKEYPFAAKDPRGRLVVGAAIGVKDDYLERAQALVEAEADVLVIDIAHGHSEQVIRTIKELKQRFGDKDIQVMAGNVATGEATEDLIQAGADVVKVGVGPGAACTTRIVTGAGVPQFTAVMNAVEVAEKYDIPIVADGGIKMSGDIVKALAAGASTVMMGSMLAGTDESPGKIIFRNGRRFKIYRGSASFGAASGREQRTTGSDAIRDDIDQIVPEGVESTVLYKGPVADIIHQCVGGLRSGMSYCGALTISEMQKNATFMRQTSAGWRESNPHDINVL